MNDYFPKGTVEYPCPDADCRRYCATGRMIAVEDDPYENACGESACSGYCYQLHPPESFEVPYEEALSAWKNADKEDDDDDPHNVKNHSIKIGTGFPFITYCDPDREILRMKVKHNGIEEEYTFRISGKERWHYVLQFANATTNFITLRPFNKKRPIKLSLVFRDNKNCNHKLFYRFIRSTGGSKAKYWLEQTQLKKRMKLRL